MRKSADYLPTSRYDINTMYQELLSWIGTVKNQYLSGLLTYYFIQDQETAKRFRMSSAAKSVHHGFVGGLLFLPGFRRNAGQGADALRIVSVCDNKNGRI